MEDRTVTLRAMRICRFCLIEKEPLSYIYQKDNKIAIPLPLQIMACVAIEVFANDGMPQLICDDCRLQTRKSYSFKTMCKRSDDALKLYIATGILTKHEKDDILKNSKTSQKRTTESDPNTESVKRAKNEDDVSQDDKIEENVTDSKESQLDLSTDNEIIQENEIIQDLPPLVKAPKQVATQCFPCIHCERSFPLQQLLDIHMRQHTRERKFGCSQCSKRFFSKHDLSKHIQIHTGEKPFSCVACKKSFSRATLLHRHEKVHITVPKYLCTYCEKTYLTSEDLDAHIKLHKKKRPFKCRVCNKNFAFKQGLERHLVVHSAENPYKCNYCEANFNTAGKLARHVTSHAGARPYPCKLCSRTFLLSHHLTRHLRNHYSQKCLNNENGEYKCDVCSMSFRRKDSLVNHTAIHSMVNLKCLICNKEFSEAKTVREHVSTHLLGLPFPCDKCDYSFDTQEELQEHEVKHIDLEEEDEYILSDLPPNETDSNFQQVNVRRSRRSPKIKNFADFLTEELDIGSEDDSHEEEEQEETSDKSEVILPIIRSETMKTYKGVKGRSPEKPIKDLIQVTSPQIDKPEQESKVQKTLTKITTLENLGISKQTLEAMAEKSGVVEMKVGQKVIRVQKLMMSKAEYQEMAKQGKLEMKGSNVVVPSKDLDLNKLTHVSTIKKSSTDPLTEPQKLSEQKVAINPDIDVQVTKAPVRTYVKKVIKIKNESESNPSDNTCSSTMKLTTDDPGSTSLLELNIVGCEKMNN